MATTLQAIEVNMTSVNLGHDTTPSENDSPLTRDRRAVIENCYRPRKKRPVLFYIYICTSAFIPCRLPGITRMLVRFNKRPLGKSILKEPTLQAYTPHQHHTSAEFRSVAPTPPQPEISRKAIGRGSHIVRVSAPVTLTNSSRTLDALPRSGHREMLITHAVQVRGNGIPPDRPSCVRMTAPTATATAAKNLKI
jgi:hypothetical protein